MKKIIFGITGLTLGGAERVLVDIANQLCNKYEITIFTIYSKGELENELDKRIKLISLFNVRYDELTKYQKIYIPLKVLFNKKKIFKEYIDNGDYYSQIAFLEGPITRIFSIKSKKNVTKIAWIHNDISKVFGRGFKSRIKRIIDRNIYEKYDTLAFVSIDNLDKFNKIYDDMDLPHEVVINNYINCDRIIQLSKNEEINKDITKLKIFNENDVNILQVSRLVKQKAIDRLIDVHVKLIKEGFNHRIFIIGDGPLRKKLELKIKQENIENSFILLGACNNPYPYIKRCDYFSLFSYFEGYPMVIEEAKALKKYILCTNTATREALINYSKYSKLVDNNNEGIEEAIKFAIKNKNRIRDLDVDYIYDNNKIINKIDKVLQDNKKHPDRVSIIENK